ncbi:type IV pilus assembly protein PilW [Alteromonadaceae bacterium 2753L.S.0a.02]|nr:type IV pilus assembly protein PilW [Alteromonadaceae bacterium 2753L.S.0a.02]
MLATTTRNSQRGIGLVEVMVSIAIGLFILAGVLQLYATSSSNSVLVAGSSRIQENARYVMARLEQDVKQAGYAGCFSLKSAYPVQYFSEAEDDFITVESRYDALLGLNGDGQLNDFSQFVDGQDEQDLGGVNYDILTVRYLSARHRRPVTAMLAVNQIATNDLSVFKNGQVAAIGDCSRVSFFEVTNDPSSDGYVEFSGDSLGRAYQSSEDIYGTGSGMERSIAYLYGGDSGVVIYKLGDSQAGACSSANPQFCALIRKNAEGLDEELVEGVEQFDVEYGWQDTDGNLYFNNASEMTDARWFFVDRVRVSMTFNSVERTPMPNGDELLKRSYQRTFLIQNQLPADYSRIASGT